MGLTEVRGFAFQPRDTRTSSTRPRLRPLIFTADLAVLTPLGTSPIGASFRPQEMREIPPVLSVRLYRTVPDVQPSCEFPFLGRGRRGDATLDYA
jgi:hypothetical protein